MQAIHISLAGGPQVLEPIACDPHPLGAGEVLIRVDHAGVNRHDINQRAVARYSNTRLPANIPGLEICGEVIAASADVQWPCKGDYVCALTDGGGYAEYCVAAAELCLTWSRARSREGAAVPEGLFTAWYNLIELAELKSGDTLLIHGGASGVGSIAIQLARARGATVWATCATPAKQAICESLGAHRTFCYLEPDFLSSIRSSSSQCARGGVDVIFDLSGLSYFNDNLQLAAPGARIVYLSSAGFVPTIDVVALTARQVWTTASRLRPLPREHKARLAKSIFDATWFDLYALRLSIDSEYPLLHAADAHRRMESGEHAGKIVLVVHGPPAASTTLLTTSQTS